MYSPLMDRANLKTKKKVVITNLIFRIKFNAVKDGTGIRCECETWKITISCVPYIDNTTCIRSK